MRNSVKAVVDAYDGTVTLYAWDPTDPVLMTWMKAFPGIVEPVENMSEEVLSHVRYPQDMFKIQRAVLSRYHVTDATTFYNASDVWIVPNDPTVSPAQVFQPPYYLTLQMPGTEAPDVLADDDVRPAATADAGRVHGGRARHPGRTTARCASSSCRATRRSPVPQQVQNNFESDPTVSSQLSLLRRGGSEVEFGNLLSLPFNDGLLYVEPVYIRATTDGYPLLRKVLVGYGQNVALENTLDVALAKVFGTSPDATADQKLTDDAPDGTARTARRRPRRPRPRSRPATPRPTWPSPSRRRSAPTRTARSRSPRATSRPTARRRSG